MGKFDLVTPRVCAGGTGAAGLVDRLHNARRIGSGRWTAACPICQSEGRRDQAALSIREAEGGKLLLRCFKLGCDFADILRAAGLHPGAWRAPDPQEAERRRRRDHAEQMRKDQRIARLWRGCEPLDQPAAALYLRNRRIDPRGLSDCLRYHPACWNGEVQAPLPALVARVSFGEGLAVHRIWITAQGHKADLRQPKASWGRTRGGFVQLRAGQPGGGIIAGSGIETTASAHHLFGDPGFSAWACLSDAGLAAVNLPMDAQSGGEPRRLVIAADRDPSGLAAARRLQARALAFGWAVALAVPPEGVGDWNDVHRSEVMGHA